MPDDLLSIGELARAGGLPVSALRFYDSAGVLRPTDVDPATGYRRYTVAQVRTARLVARLRQAGLPVAEMLDVLAEPRDAHVVLTRHRQRLEEDLAAARAHLDAAAAIVREPGRGTVAAADLVAAVAAVRHAVGPDRAWPGLAGVLLHLQGDALRLVASDRYRLALASLPVRRPSGPEVRVIVPLDLLDQVTAAPLPDDGEVVLHPSAVEILGRTADPLDAAFPPYERLLAPAGTRGATVAAEDLVRDAAGPGDVVAVRLADGRVQVVEPDDGDVHGFSRTFLLDAVRAVRAEHVALALDEDRAALSVTAVDRPGDVGLVMPVLLRR